MDEEKLFESGKFMIRHFKGFSRRHWISSPRFDFIYDFIDKLEKFQDLSLSQKRFIKKKLISCRYKLCALEYHDKNIVRIEKEYKKTLKNILKNPSFKEFASIETIIPEIMFEFEAFLFQCKAFLDIYSQAVGNFFGQKPTNIKKLKKVLMSRKEAPAYKLLKLLEKSIWLTEFESSKQFKKTKRDIITHYSIIKLSCISVQKLERKKFNTIRTKIENKLVLDYTRTMIKRLRILMFDTIKIIEEHMNM